jgi:hypothetical protein
LNDELRKISPWAPAPAKAQRPKFLINLLAPFPKALPDDFVFGRRNELEWVVHVRDSCDLEAALPDIIKPVISADEVIDAHAGAGPGV